LANLYQGAGWEVIRINYLGDWGKQYGILAIGFDTYGNEEELEKDPINHLFKVYVKISADKEVEENKIKAAQEAGEDISKLRAQSIDERARVYFKAMTDREPKAIAQWKKWRDLSIEKYKKTYARLNIHYDVYSGESQVPEESMAKALQTMKDKKLTEDSDGSVIIDFSKHVPGKPGKSLEKTVIQRKDGTALYLTRDISEIKQREETYNFDQMIYVVASQQDLHLKQLFKIVDLMGYKDLASKVQHINFGMVAGMSTRKGTVKFLDDILEDVGDKMHEVMRKNEEKYSQVENPEATADILGITSVMVQDMSGKRYASSLKSGCFLKALISVLGSITTPST
jgi:arginyl-tRNA synthetase